jgi:hypothetical protein
MASLAAKVLPDRLKPASAANGGGEGDFARKHHGKTQSHVVSPQPLGFLFSLRF